MDDLESALTLATDEELQDLAELLFRPRFNPLDYLVMPRPAAVQGYSRTEQIAAIAQRFRFLAADGVTVLKGQSQHLEYRQVLLQICLHLKIEYTSHFSTTDLESEILLAILQQSSRKLSKKDYQALNQQLRQAFQNSALQQQLPEETQQDPLGLVLTGGGVLALGSLLRPLLLRQLSQHWMLYTTKSLAARQMITAGKGLVGNLARRTTAVSLARYSTLRSTLAFIGPVLWGWLAVDLGWRAIAVNYSRVIPFVFILAQIRLTRI